MKLLAILAALLLAGCSSHASLPAPQALSANRHAVSPGWTYTTLHKIAGMRVVSRALVTDVARGKLWASVDTVNGLRGALEEIDPSHIVTGYFKLKIVPDAIAQDSNGDLWLTSIDSSGTIAHVTPTGVETDFTVAPGMRVAHIIVGPDNAMWFTQCATDKSGGIGRIDTQGGYTFYPSACQQAIAAGPDTNIWFAGGPYVYKMTPQGVMVGQYATGYSGYWDMTTGPDGAMYVLASKPATFVHLLQVSMDGTINDKGRSYYSESMYSIASGPLGELWMAGVHQGIDRKLERFSPAVGWYGDFINPPTYKIVSPAHGRIVVGPGGYIWSANDLSDQVATYKTD